MFKSKSEPILKNKYKIKKSKSLTQIIYETLDDDNMSVSDSLIVHYGNDVYN